MNKIPLEVGRVVRSKAGRDAGRLFVIISELDSDYVLMCDGALRGKNRPKKKKRKHLEATGAGCKNAALLQDYQIRELLKAQQPHEEG